MSEDSLILKMLIDLREEMRQANTRIDQTNVRIDQTNVRLDGRIDETNTRMDLGFTKLRREIRDEFTEHEIRAATRHTEHMAATRDLYGLLQDRFELRDRMERVETDIVELKKKVG